ncbi:hypothetical protein FRB99_000392, partial [Tulasnella sp. 403]
MQRTKLSNGIGPEQPSIPLPGDPLSLTTHSARRSAPPTPNGHAIIVNGTHFRDQFPAKSSQSLSSPTLEITPPRARISSSTSAVHVSSPLSSSSGNSGGLRSPNLNPTRTFYAQQQPHRSYTYPEPPLTTSPFRTSFSLSGTAIPESGETTEHDFTSRSLRHSRSQSGAISPRQSLVLPIPGPSSPTPPPPPKSPRLSAPTSPLLTFSDSPDGSASVFDDRRHSRIHSRNLSIFFPRPGDGPQVASVTDDGAQEIEYSGDSQITSETLVFSSNSDGMNKRSSLSANFQFGGKNPYGGAPMSPRPSNVPKRRGHHHKHSVSHNFFSFMEPTSTYSTAPNQPSTLSTSSTPFTQTLPTPTTTHFPSSAVQHHYVDPTPGTSTATTIAKPRSKSISASPVMTAKLFAVFQFILGAWTWVEGQRQGSLACTGLGYWVVFDAIGIWLGFLGEQMRREPTSLRRPYGSRRAETVALFAQSIYLLFASVYVCKEA